MTIRPPDTAELIAARQIPSDLPVLMSIFTTARGRERRYQARWVDPDGPECFKIFSRRTDAEDKIKEVEHSKLDGSYIDHKNPIIVAQYAKQWSTTRSHRSTTATRVKSMIDNHICPNPTRR